MSLLQEAEAPDDNSAVLGSEPAGVGVTSGMLAAKKVSGEPHQSSGLLPDAAKVKVEAVHPPNGTPVQLVASHGH